MRKHELRLTEKYKFLQLEIAVIEPIIKKLLFRYVLYQMREKENVHAKANYARVF